MSTNNLAIELQKFAKNISHISGPSGVWRRSIILDEAAKRLIAYRQAEREKP